MAMLDDEEEVVVEKIKAVREFTDRVDHRNVFWENCEYLINDQVDKREYGIISYYGAGGVGKTTLLKKLQSELDEKNLSLNKNIYKFIHYDFDSNNTNMMDVLKKMREDLTKFGCEFPLFDIGEFSYQLMIGKKIPEPEVKSLLNKQPTVRKWMDKVTNTADAVANVSTGISIVNSVFNTVFENADVIDEIAESVPCYKLVKGLVKAANKKAVKYIDEKTPLDKAHNDIKIKLNALIKDVRNPKKLEDYLPTLFARDVSDWLINKKEHLIIFIDTYEKLVNEAKSEKTEWEKSLWLKNKPNCPFAGNNSEMEKGLVFTISPKRTLWVITGRDKLRWWGKDDDKFIDQHYVEALSEEDSIYFLNRAGIITKTLQEKIYKFTGGSPFYLDACVEMYENYMNCYGKEPSIEEFGVSRDKVVERMIKYMDASTEDMIRCLIALKVWTNEMAYKIVPNFSSTVYENQVRNFSFIQSEKPRENLEVYKFDRTVQRLLFDKFSQENEYLYKDIRDRASAYFAAEIAKKGIDNESLRFHLEQWAKIISRLTNDADELQTQFETHLYNVLKSLDWKMYNVKANIVETFFNRAVALTTPDTLPYAYFLYQYGKVKRNKNEYKVAYEYMRSAYEIFAKLLGDEHEYSMKALYSLAKMSDLIGKKLDSVELYKKYINICEKLNGVEDEKTLSTMEKLAKIYQGLEKYTEMLTINNKVLTATSNKFDVANDKVLEAYSNVAFSLQKLGEVDKAINIMQKYFDILHEKGDINKSEILCIRRNIAGVMNKLGKKDIARGILRKNIDILRNKLSCYIDNIDNLDENSLQVAFQIVDDIGLNLMFMPDENETSFYTYYEEDLELRRNMVAVYKKVLGVENEKTLETMIDLGQSLVVSPTNEDMMNEMVSVWKEIVEVAEKLWGEEDERTIEQLNNLAMWADYGDHKEEANAANKKLLAIEKKIFEENKLYYGEADLKTVYALNKVADRLHNLEHNEEALKLKEELLDICKKYFDESDEKTINAMQEVASLSNSMKKYDEEIKIRKEIVSILKNSVGELDEKTIENLDELAWTYSSLNQYDESLKIQQEILNIKKKKFGDTADENIEAMRDIIYTLDDLGKNEEAMSMRMSIISLIEKKTNDAREKLEIMKKLYREIIEDNNYRNAFDVLKKMLDIAKNNFGDDADETIKIKQSMVCAMISLKMYEDALLLQNEILSSLTLNKGKNYSLTLSAEINKIYILCEAENYDEATQLSQKIFNRLKTENKLNDYLNRLNNALEISETLFGNENQNTNEILSLFKNL